MAWAGHPPSSLGVYGQILSRSGTKVGNEFLIHSNAVVAELGGLCFGQGHFLAVWSASTTASKAALIQGRLWTGAGTLVGEVLSLGVAESNDQEFPCAVPGSTNFLVTWIAQRDDTNVWDVLGRFVDTAGQASAEFVISQSPVTLVLGDVRVIYAFEQLTDPLSQYLWSHFTEAGRQSMVACGSSNNYRGPYQTTLVRTEQMHLWRVLYETQRFAGVNLSPETRELLAQNPQGEDLICLNRRLLAEAYFMQIRSSYAWSPALAAHPVMSGFDGTNHLVVWSRGGPSWPFRLPGYDAMGYPNQTNLALPMIVGRLVSGSGEPIDNEFEISRARGGQFLPSVVFDGTNYLVSWIDRRRDSFDWDEGWTWPTATNKQTVFLQFVSTTGALVESEFGLWENYYSTRASPSIM